MKKCYGAFDLGPWGQQNVSTKAGSNGVLFVEKLQMDGGENSIGLGAVLRARHKVDVCTVRA